MLCQMQSEDEIVKLLAVAFPDRTHVVVRDRYFAQCPERSAPTVSKGNGMPTVQNLCEVQRNSGVGGEN